VLDQRGENCLVLTNHDNCLWAFAREDWRIIEEKAYNLPLFDHAVTSYLRYFISAAVECLVRQGRITIPLDLRESVKLQREVVLVGQLKRFEIWERKDWEKEFPRVKESFLEDSQALRELGI